MKHIPLLLVFTLLFHFSSVNAQNKKIKGSISSDTADLKILSVSPKLFPHVSVLFKAETRNGEPVWNLTKQKMKAKEDNKECEVISLEQISKNKPLNIGVVIDHSGSMQYDNLVAKEGNEGFSIPKGYKAPIDNAKQSVKAFIKSFNAKKDFISVIGFSGKVDKLLALTKDTIQLNATVDSMQADFSTALYDAMITGIKEIKNADGIKVLVVLTDGLDNASANGWKDVVKESVQENIPVYIIGLGDVNIDTLQLIASSTNGQFYYTKTSSSLDTIYNLISKQVQAFYDLVYSSANYLSADSTRNIELSFDIDSIYLVTNPFTQHFPAEVVAVMEKREKRQENLLYGGILIAFLLTAGTVGFYFKKKAKHKNVTIPVIKKIFPNPSNGVINLDYESRAGQLQISDMTGLHIKILPITGHEKQFNLSGIGNGTFIAVIESGGIRSNIVKFIIQY